MSIIRYHKAWHPLDHFETLREEVDRLLSGAEDPLSSGLHNRWNPTLDITQDKEAVHVKVELPGMKKEAIELSLHENILTISGERKLEHHQEQGSKLIREERVYGRFQRTVSLPAPINLAEVKATYRDGILTVDLPKAEEAKPKQIEVSVA